MERTLKHSQPIEGIALNCGTTHYLKTDTNAVNEKMQGLFASCGYVAVGDIKLEGKDGDFRCFEKVIEA